ncbi:DUF2993 domain-containing protein [Streptomyces sp. NPDC006879]|uniref:LmeA family phospholipid-binding protein n=1 Tax=Streptomyces sp. NPDC006879 TaxID=3364767 RepID=UPI00367BDA0B
MRGVRKPLIAVAALAALLVGADRLAVVVAENRAAEQVEFGTGSPDSTEVAIHGFPFVTQLPGKRLDAVDLSLRGVPVTTSEGRSLRITELKATGHQVRLRGDWSAAEVAQVEGSALISYQDLTEAAPEGVRVGYGGAPGKLRLTVTADLLGREFSQDIVSDVSLVGADTFRVRAEELPGMGLPGLEELIRTRTDFDRPVHGLPEGVKLTGLTTDASGIRAALAGTDVPLGT